MKLKLKRVGKHLMKGYELHESTGIKQQTFVFATFSIKFKLCEEILTRTKKESVATHTPAISVQVLNSRKNENYYFRLANEAVHNSQCLRQDVLRLYIFD